MSNNKRISLATDYFFKFFGKERPENTREVNRILKNYKGFDFSSEEDMKKLCNVFHINIQTYVLKGKGLKGDVHGPDSFFTGDTEVETTLNLKMTVEENGFMHSEFISDVEKFTNIAVCPKCHEFNRDIHRHIYKVEFDEHVETCTGKMVDNKVLKLKEAMPYCPIYKNKEYAYMYCKGFAEYYRPITDYITFDLETVEEYVYGCAEKSTRVIAKIHPHTGAANIDAGTSIFMKGKNFMHRLIAELFKYSKIIVERNVYKQIPGASE
jgi:hypothetical protein